ncbi:MAG: hypothetical protein HKO62_12710 [Gammaproteobacteria bacterium]|nr:hypothetical protein [Gammaproteobacteria bacterium]
MTAPEPAVTGYISALQDGRFDDAARIANDCRQCFEQIELKDFDAAADAALDLLRGEFFRDLEIAEKPAADAAWSV